MPHDWPPFHDDPHTRAFDEELQRIDQATRARAKAKPTLTGSVEVRVVDEKTGGEKGSKLARFSLIPPDFEWALAEHYGKGSRKYADRNWEKGYKWSLSLDALRRHLVQFLNGERYDVCGPGCPVGCTEHTGSHHLVAAAWHTVALWWFDTHQKGTNDVAPNLPTL